MKKILILRTEHIGDYLISLPAIKAIKEKFPDYQIDLVVGPWNKELAEATPYVDKVIIFENPFAKRNLTYLEILKIILFKSKDLYKFYKKINKEDYELLISFSDRKFNKLFLRFINSKKKISGVDFNFGEIYEKERCLNILKEAGISIQNKEVNLRYTKKDKERVERILEEYNLKDKKILILHLFTPLEDKDWSIDRWIKILNRLILKNKDMRFVLVGTKEDEKRTGRLIKKLKNCKNLINLVGKTSMLELVLLIKNSDYFIGSCSGPLHIADLFDKPRIGLFSSGSGKRWEPIEGNGFSLRGTKMENIAIKDVLTKLKSLNIQV